MELGIVIPLKAKCVSKNWALTCSNLRDTIRSLANQTSDRFYAVVVGHDRPDFFSSGTIMGESQCEFLEFKDAPPPVIDEDEPRNQLKYEADRCSKILNGIIYLNSKFPAVTHWFALDADDLLHRDFIKSLSGLKPDESVVIEKGYFYFKNTGIINLEDEFSAYCGSSAILSKLLFDLPVGLTASDFRSTPFGSVSHVRMKKHLADLGVKVSSPEERLLMYVRDHGENISNAAYCNTFVRRLKRYIKSRMKSERFGESLRRDFGLQ